MSLTRKNVTISAVKAGGDINCGPEYSQLVNATKHGFITEAELDVSVRRLMRRRMQTGDLDSPPQTPYAKIPTHQIDTPEHKAVAHKIVQESIVMLTNGKTAANEPVLPMDATKLKSILVVGPTSDDITVQAHTYHGTPSKWITVLGGINQTLQKIAPQVKVTYMQGCDRESTGPTAKKQFGQTVAAVAHADAVIFVGGLQANMEEEGTDRISNMGHPGVQLELIKALQAAGKPLVPTPRNFYVNLPPLFLGHFSPIFARFFPIFSPFSPSCRQDSGNRHQDPEKRSVTVEKRPAKNPKLT